MRLRLCRSQQLDLMGGGSPEGGGGHKDGLSKCILDLHSTIFHSYETGWCPLVQLKPRPSALTEGHAQTSATSPSGCHLLLCELSLYFLIWSEAANVRHCPEAMWFLFWCCVHCPAFSSLSLRQTPHEYFNHSDLALLRDRRVKCRNEFKVQSQLSLWIICAINLAAGTFESH